MATNDVPPPDLTEQVNAWVWSAFGFWGLVAFAACGAVFFVYSNWDSVSRWPGMPWLLNLVTRKAMPKADSKRFSVLVARLNNDTDHEHQKLILDLLRGFEGVQVLALDRVIPANGTGARNSEKEGHEKARDYLTKAGASILILGRVLKLG
ncbi:MAG: hypothetical protein EXQ90_06845, partial [Rhodospirillales bacterium]|nr:hypothetical protein [Rhodospirillales bacterium]